jgi:hypothetical protein
MDTPEIHWINRRRGSMCERCAMGWKLYGSYGYIGTYSTLREALERFDRLP